MPRIFTLEAGNALSEPLEGFELYVFSLYYYFFHIVADKTLTQETKPNKIPKISQQALTSVSVVPQLVLIF